MKRRSRRPSFGVAAAVVPPDELDEHALAVREPWPRLTRLTAPAAPNKSTALTAEEVAIGSCASIGEAFRALPLEAHFASMRSRVCVAIAHRHAPDHFDVVLAVAAMLFAVLRQSVLQEPGCIVSPLSNVGVDIESSTLL